MGRGKLLKTCFFWDGCSCQGMLIETVGIVYLKKLVCHMTCINNDAISNWILNFYFALYLAIVEAVW